MELFDFILRISIALLIVILSILFILPFMLRRFWGIKVSGGEGSFEVKKIVPVSKGIYIVEVRVKDTTILLCVGEKGADVIYREDDKGPLAEPDSGGSGSSADHTTGRDKGWRR